MTYVLVSVGATVFMLTNQYVSMVMPGTDPTRFGAQVISGIGFLGAGTIIVTRQNEIRGLRQLQDYGCSSSGAGWVLDSIPVH